MQKHNQLIFICALILLFNLSLYFFPVFLGLSKIGNLVIFLFAAVALREYIIIVAPFYIYSPASMHSGIPLFFMAISASFVFFLFSEKKFKFDNSGFAYLLLFFSAVIGLLRAENTNLALECMEPYIKAFMPIFLIAYLRKKTTFILPLMIAFAAASATSILYKFLYMEHTDQINSQSGIYFEDFKGKLDLYDTGSRDFVRRLLYVGQEPNYTGAVQTLGLVASIRLLELKSLSQVLKALALICLILNYVQMVGGYSRSSFVVATLIVIISLSINWKTILFYFFAAMAGLSYLAVNSSLMDRLMSISTNKTATNRTDLWANAIDLWSENPVFGSGFTDYFYYFGDAAHSTFLQILAEQGFVGFMCFLFLVKIITRLKFKVPFVDPRSFYAGLLGLLVMIQSVSFFQIDLLVYMLFMLSIFSMSEHAICSIYLKPDLKKLASK